MKRTNNGSKSSRYNIKRLVNICGLLTAGTLVGTVLYLRQIDSFIRELAASHETVSYGYSTLLGYSVLTTGGKTFHAFNWGAVILFLLIFALILLEVGISGREEKQPDAAGDNADPDGTE